MALYGDALLNRFFLKADPARPRGARGSDYASVPLSLLLLFILFASVPAFFSRLPAAMRHLHNQIGASRDIARGRPFAQAEVFEFMRRYFSPEEEVPIFSSKYDTIFYLEARTTNPVRAPGWADLFFMSEVGRYADYLAEADVERFLVGDDFPSLYPAFPELYALMEQRFVEVDRVEDLALFERRLPER
jgi:hypothetical protein